MLSAIYFLALQRVQIDDACTHTHTHTHTHMLSGSCKSDCSFALLNFAVWYWNTFLNVIMLYIILMCIYCFIFFFANELTFCIFYIYTNMATKFCLICYIHLTSCQPTTTSSSISATLHGKLEKEMAPHSSVLAWRIPGTEEPGGLPSGGSHRVRHDWSDFEAAAWKTLPQPARVINSFQEFTDPEAQISVLQE